MKILLANGVSHDEFAEAAKYAFIKVAEQDFPEKKKVIPSEYVSAKSARRKEQSSSYLSGLTGLNRKDVSRIKKEISGELKPKETFSRQAKLVDAWRTLEKYTDSQGNPKPLPREGAISVTSLVEDCKVDIPVAAAIGVLTAAHLCWDDGEHLQLHERGGYLPYGDPVEMARIMGEHCHHFHQTMEYNLRQDVAEEEKLYEKAATVINIPIERIPEIKDYLIRHGDKWLNTWDDHLEKQSCRHDLKQIDSETVTAGIGVYFFMDKEAGE